MDSKEYTYSYMFRIRAHTQTNIYRSLQYFVSTVGTRSGRRITLGE